MDENESKLMEEIKEKRYTISGKLLKEFSEELRKAESEWEEEVELEEEKDGLLEEMMG